MAMVGETLGELQDVTIVLESDAHFHGPNGAAVHLKPGSYHVSVGHDGHLLLGAKQAPEAHGAALRAYRTWHGVTLTAPLAVSIPAAHDRCHIALLLPGGAALQASGSFRSPAAPADTPTFATAHDVAQAIIMKFPGPVSPHHSFNAATVLSVPGLRPLWGTIEPGSNPSTFVPGSAPPYWISATVAACSAVAGVSCPGVGTSEPRNPPASEPQLVSTTPVTVKSLLSWAGQTVELLVTAQVVNTGGLMRYMTWTDLYRQVPTANGPLTFPGVIVASGTPPNQSPQPGKMTWAQETAYIFTSPSGRGAPTDFELRVNGITQAFRSCEYLGHYPGGVPELRCS